MEKYLKILQDLVRIESVNDHERQVAEYIEGVFKGRDRVESQIIDSYPGRANIIVKVKGKRPGKIFAFSGHLDVVAPGEGWTHPPFGGEIQDGKLYGRGTCDMKAGVAASIYAILDILEEDRDFPGEIWFIGTVGEEIGMQGALDLVEGGYLDGVDAILISEPTKRDGENQAIFACKGSIMYTIQSQGRSAHSSMPDLGINSILALSDYIHQVQEEFDQVTANPAYQNKDLGSTINVFSMIQGGNQVNSVPEKAWLKGNIRTVPEFGSDKAIGLLQDFIEKNNQDPTRASLSLELDQVLDPAQAGRDNTLIQALKKAGQGKNIQVRPLIGACELCRYINLPGEVQLLVYGPGLTKNAHVVDEYIELDEYLDTIEIFKKTALDFLGRPEENRD